MPVLSHHNYYWVGHDMNNQQSMSEIGAVLSTVGANDAIMAACEEIYSGTYKSPPMKASELAAGEGISLSDIRKDIVYRLAGGVARQDGDDFDQFVFDSALEDIDQAMPMIKPSDMVCYLCNYKGEESESGAYALDTERFPVFRGKYNYQY